MASRSTGRVLNCKPAASRSSDSNLVLWQVSIYTLVEAELWSFSLVRGKHMTKANVPQTVKGQVIAMTNLYQMLG